MCRNGPEHTKTLLLNATVSVNNLPKIRHHSYVKSG